MRQLLGEHRFGGLSLLGERSAQARQKIFARCVLFKPVNTPAKLFLSFDDPLHVESESDPDRSSCPCTAKSKEQGNEGLKRFQNRRQF